MRAWWAERSERERRLLAVMFALLGLTLLWFGILQPLYRAEDRAKARLLTASDEAGLIAGRSAVLKSAGPRARGTQPLADLVRTSATEAGFTLTSANPAGADGVAARIESAKAPALFAWLGRLEARGVVIDALSVRPNADQTLAADVTLRLPAP